MKNENIYQDPDSGAWIAEYFSQGRWHRLGVYGTRKSAREALIRSRTALAPIRGFADFWTKKDLE